MKYRCTRIRGRSKHRVPAQQLCTVPARLVPEPSCISVLEQALSEAKEGRLVSVAVAAVTHKNESRTAFTTSRAITLMGSVQCVARRIYETLE
jgi:hypothetical protein